MSSRPFSKNAPSNNQYGGAEELEAKYRHGAEKYHYKCQAAVRELMRQGQKCPQGYEMYLKPFQG